MHPQFWFFYLISHYSVDSWPFYDTQPSRYGQKFCCWTSDDFVLVDILARICISDSGYHSALFSQWSCLIWANFSSFTSFIPCEVPKTSLQFFLEVFNSLGHLAFLFSISVFQGTILAPCCRAELHIEYGPQSIVSYLWDLPYILGSLYHILYVLCKWKHALLLLVSSLRSYYLVFPSLISLMLLRGCVSGFTSLTCEKESMIIFKCTYFFSGKRAQNFWIIVEITWTVSDFKFRS